MLNDEIFQLVYILSGHLGYYQSNNVQINYFVDVDGCSAYHTKIMVDGRKEKDTLTLPYLICFNISDYNKKITWENSTYFKTREDISLKSLIKEVGIARDKKLNQLLDVT